MVCKFKTVGFHGMTGTVVVIAGIGFVVVGHSVFTVAHCDGRNQWGVFACWRTKTVERGRTVAMAANFAMDEVR